MSAYPLSVCVCPPTHPPPISLPSLCLPIPSLSVYSPPPPPHTHTISLPSLCLPVPSLCVCLSLSPLPLFHHSLTSFCVSAGPPPPLCQSLSTFLSPHSPSTILSHLCLSVFSLSLVMLFSHPSSPPTPRPHVSFPPFSLRVPFPTFACFVARSDFFRRQLFRFLMRYRLNIHVTFIWLSCEETESANCDYFSAWIFFFPQLFRLDTRLLHGVCRLYSNVEYLYKAKRQTNNRHGNSQVGTGCRPEGAGAAAGCWGWGWGVGRAKTKSCDRNTQGRWAASWSMTSVIQRCNRWPGQAVLTHTEQRY